MGVVYFYFRKYGYNPIYCEFVKLLKKEMW
jgi:hypothetical protein